MNKEKRSSGIGKIALSLAVVLIALTVISEPGYGNQWMLFHDSEIKGSVIDVETQKPIEGVIVVGMWRLSQFLSQGFGGYAKIILVKTDSEGKFVIPSWTTLKLGTFDSSMHDLAPEIVIYKPGYKFYFSHRIMREGFPGDISKTEEEKEKLKEKYNLNPAKLVKIYTDEERVNNLNAIENAAKLYDIIENLDKRDSIVLVEAIEKEYLLLPQALKERYIYIEQIGKRLRGGSK